MPHSRLELDPKRRLRFEVELGGTRPVHEIWVPICKIIEDIEP